MPRDPLFAEGDKLSKINEAILLTIEDVEEFLHRDFQEFSCQVPGCKASFSQLYECEQHYRSAHQYACASCRKSLPSNHLLELHIQESHDSFFAVLAERKPSYQCFLPTCDSLFWNAKERRDHAITVHTFPPDFRFDESKRHHHQLNSGRKKPGPVKKQLPQLESQKKTGEHPAANGDSDLAAEGGGEGPLEGSATSSSMEIDEEAAGNGGGGGGGVVFRRDGGSRRPLSLARMGERRSLCVDAMTSPSSAVSQPAVRGVPAEEAEQATSTTASPKRSKIPVRSNSCRVPKNISFGAGVSRGFHRPRSKHWYQSSQSVDTAIDIEKSDMSELASCLPPL